MCEVKRSEVRGERRLKQDRVPEAGRRGGGGGRKEANAERSVREVRSRTRTAAPRSGRDPHFPSSPPQGSGNLSSSAERRHLHPLPLLSQTRRGHEPVSQDQDTPRPEPLRNPPVSTNGDKRGLKSPLMFSITSASYARRTGG